MWSLKSYLQEHLYADMSLDKKTEVEDIFIAVCSNDEWRITLNLKPNGHPKISIFVVDAKRGTWNCCYLLQKH